MESDILFCSKQGDDKDIELLNNNSHGLSPSGGLVSPSGGFLSLLCDQGLHFALIKLCLALSRQGAIIKSPVVRCHCLWCLGAQYGPDWLSWLAGKSQTASLIYRFFSSSLGLTFLSLIAGVRRITFYHSLPLQISGHSAVSFSLLSRTKRRINRKASGTNVQENKISYVTSVPKRDPSSYGNYCVVTYC
jgi:hypothetical protein